MLEKYVREVFLKYKVKKIKRASSGIRTKEETSLEQEVKAHEGYLSQTEALEAATRFLLFTWGRGDLQCKRDRRLKVTQPRVWNIKSLYGKETTKTLLMGSVK